MPSVEWSDIGSMHTVDLHTCLAGTSHQGADSLGEKRPFHWLRNILPRDALEARILATVGVARLLLVPAAAFAIVEGLAAAGLLPNDPVCKLVLLVEGSMPTAQNLVLLMNLHDNTRHLSEKAGRLMLRLYPIAILPVTIWMTFFVQRLPVAVSAL